MIVRKQNADRLSIILYYTRDYTVRGCATNNEVSTQVLNLHI